MNVDHKNFQNAFVMKPLYATCLPIAGSIFIFAILALHLIQSEMSILDEAISYYVHGEQGWLLIIGLLGLGVGSLSLTFVLNKIVKESYGRAGIVLLFIWSFGVIIGAIFPTDPPGSWNKPPSLFGMIHGNVALLAFVSFPFAALFISKSLDRYKGIPTKTRGLLVWALLSILCLGFLVVSILPVFISPGPPKLFGLSERMLLGVYICWIIAVATKLLRPSNPNSRVSLTSGYK